MPRLVFLMGWRLDRNKAPMKNAAAMKTSIGCIRVSSTTADICDIYDGFCAYDTHE
jgi:hypothetical protein